MHEDGLQMIPVVSAKVINRVRKQSGCNGQLRMDSRERGRDQLTGRESGV